MAWILWQIILSIVIIVGLMVIVGGGLYLFSMFMLSFVRFFPPIGHKHRHDRWQELTQHSARGGAIPDAPRNKAP